MPTQIRPDNRGVTRQPAFCSVAWWVARYRAVFWLLIVAVLTGCLAGCVHFESQLISPSASLDELESRSLDDPGLRKFISRHTKNGKVDSSVWGLNELTLAAFYFHPDLAAARAEQRQAKAQFDQSKELPNPVLTLGPGYNSTSAGISPWILATALDLPFEWPIKRRLRQREAAKKEEASYQRLAATAWSVRNRVRKEMLALYSAERMQSVLSQQESVQARIVAILNAKRDAGEASAFEASQSRLGLNQTRLSLHEAERQASVSRVRLAEAVGITGRELAGVSLNYSSFSSHLPPIKLGAARRDALTNRADIFAALAEYAAAEEALHLEIAKQYPDLNLGPGYELDQTDNKWSLGISVEIPVLNQNQGRIAEAEAARELARARFEQVQSAALAEIDVAVADLRGAHQKTGAAREIVTEVREEEATARKIEEAGETEHLELLQRELEVSSGQLALVDAEIGELDALGALEDALQKPFAVETSAAVTGNNHP